ncbi:MAG TPA: SpoIIE family protein phosphatase [Anaerovoracaceae bacterium]|nr:SpoIIE family protein phosphatase [Anaerovoracaceae bacterium]
MLEEAREGEKQYALILDSLRRKKENFRSLGNLYGAAADSRQILSYQFLGMEKVVDNIITTMQGTEIRSGQAGSQAGGHVRDHVGGYGCGQASSQLGKYSIATATTGYSIEGVSGDSGLCTVLADGRVAMILSDGMGKGAAASVESKLVVTTLAKLLDSGFDVDLAMKTINGMLLTKEQSEIFATVDLALINPRTARAKLFKMGAATTFVRHGDKVAIAKAPTLPLGILGALNLEYMDVKLRRGDMLVMVSDGVTDCDRRDPHADWLRDKLLAITSHDPDTIAELIINKAAEKYGLKERDDLTVLVAVVS